MARLAAESGDGKPSTIDRILVHHTSGDGRAGARASDTFPHDHQFGAGGRASGRLWFLDSHTSKRLLPRSYSGKHEMTVT